MEINCPWCGANHWRRCQFGIATNYHQCMNCFGTTPPRLTIIKTIKDIQKAASPIFNRINYLHNK